MMIMTVTMMMSPWQVGDRSKQVILDELEMSSATYARKEIVVKFRGGVSKMLVLNNLDFPWFSRSLKDLESSGRPRGRIST